MGLIDNIKKDAQNNGSRIGSSDAAALEKILGKMFRLSRRVEEETEFLRLVMTRGQETQERKGLHASEMIVPEKNFCVRKQVLSLHYRQLQGENLSEDLLRIFEEGNAVHEKWQRLLIRAGYADPKELDKTLYDPYVGLSFSPDIICEIPEFYGGGKMVGEIKSVNTFQFSKMVKHPSAWKQLQFYMLLLKRFHNLPDECDPAQPFSKGFVLCEDKNNQNFKVEVYDYDPAFSKQFSDRVDAVIREDAAFIETKKPPKRHVLCNSSDCKMAETCQMRDCCWNIGEGRRKL